MEADDLNLVRIYKTATRYWWLLLSCAILAGLLGLFYASTRSSIYEASATLIMSVDRNRAEIPDDITIYQADDRVRALILSDDTLEGLIDRLSNLPDSRHWENPAEIRTMLRIAQGMTSIQLYFYADDPALAAAGANAWAETSIDALEEAYIYAVRAADIQGALYEAHCSLEEQAEDGSASAVWVCTSAPSDLDASELPGTLLKEAEASRGILPFYSFTIAERAAAPGEPIIWSRGGFILAGMALGFLIGLSMIILLAYKQEVHQEGHAD